MHALALTLVLLSEDAPADRYFGAQKMSAIGVRMKIDDLGRRYHNRQIADGDLLHDAAIAEDALHSWAAKFPRDVWIAPTAYHLAQLYMEVQTSEARADAKRAFAYVTTAAPNSKEARLARARLNAGFPPLHPESPVVGTSSPVPVTTAVPSGASASPAPATSAPSAAPASAAPASPSAAPSPAATLRGVLEKKPG